MFIPQCQEEKKISAEFDEAGLVLERKGEGVIFETSGIHGEANGISIILYFIRDWSFIDDIRGTTSGRMIRIRQPQNQPRINTILFRKHEGVL